MKKLLPFLVFFLFFGLGALVLPNDAGAQVCSANAEPGVAGKENTLRIGGSPLKPAHEYRAVLSLETFCALNRCIDFTKDPEIKGLFLQDGALVIKRPKSTRDTFIEPGTHNLQIWDVAGGFVACSAAYTIRSEGFDCTVLREPNEPGVNQNAKLTFRNLGRVAPDLKIEVPQFPGDVGKFEFNRVAVRVTPPKASDGTPLPGPTRVTKDQRGDAFIVEVGGFRALGEHQVSLVVGDRTICTASVPVSEQPGDQNVKVLKKGEGVAALTPSTGPTPCNPETGELLENLNDVEAKGISTALGCIPIRNTNEFVAWFLKWAIGIAGGVAFLLIVVSSLQIMTAAGNPEKLQGGRELLTAAISGLILIIFSVFLLQLIGVQILQIPGFAG